MRCVIKHLLCVCMLSHFSRVASVVQPYWLEPARLLCPRDSPGKNNEVSCHAFLQGIFPTQRSNQHLLHLLHCRWILYHWATRGGSPRVVTNTVATVLTTVWKYTMEKQFIHPKSMFSSVAQSCLTLCNPMDCSTPGLPVHPPTPKACSNSRPWNRWCHPIISSSVVPFSSCPQSSPASESSNESVLCIKRLKYRSFSISVSPSNEYSGLISFRMDWLDLLAVQEALKSLLQHHSSKASILQHSAFFIVSLSYPYMTTGKIIALTRQTFVGKVIPLLFNMLSRLVIAFHWRSKHLLISWLQSPSAVILEPNKVKSITVSIVSPSVCHELMGPDAMILVFWMLSFKPAFPLSSFTVIKRLFSCSLSTIRVVSSAYLRLLIFLPAILIPACAKSMLGKLNT